MAPGARIEAGQLVGWVGDSGNAESSPPHLHFELHKPGGVVINPYDSLVAATVLNAPLGHGNSGGCDYDDDGYDDLAVGVPGEDLAGGAKVDAGAVTVIYGTADGLSASGAQQITQGTPGVGSKAQGGEQFGYATACGDVNGDGYDDLVVGVPGEDVAGKADAGAINLILGGEGGLAAEPNNFWHQARAGVATPAEIGDRFGEALVVGDFDGDGFADVAVGAPGETIGGKASAGMVIVLYGSSAGLDGTTSHFSEAMAAIAGRAEPGDGFGASLTSGDFNQDDRADLAIGIPGEDSPSKTDSGAVVAVYGSPAGLVASGSQRFSQYTAGVAGVPRGNEWFGTSVAAGDFNADGSFDLAIGTPGDRSSGIAAGGVNVIYGSGSGLTTSGSKLFQQDVGGIVGDSLRGDMFGISMAIGDFDADGKHDLAIGAAHEDLGPIVDAGSVTVVFGSAGGLTASRNELWSQETDGIRGVGEPGDQFGRWLTSGDFAGLGVSSLAVGVPLEDTPTKVDTGVIQIIVGVDGVGLSVVGDQVWGQDVAGIPNVNQPGDSFGHVGSVATG